jgi:uncharacterized protein YjbI with pentapeptide repeats
MLHNSPHREESQVIQLPHHRWRPTSVRGLLWVVCIVAVLAFAIIVFCSYLFEWKGTGFPGQTAWDWLELLIVPVVLVIGGYLLTERQRSLDREIAAGQTHADRDIADQRRQDNALQAYLDHIGKLLLDNDKPLRQSKEGDAVRTLARARTLTILRRLDGGRKGSVVEFLYESGLITTGRSVLSLAGADLIAAYLIAADLKGANLSGAKLGDADLREASLRGANLYGADLSGADLSRAFLGGANVYGADLKGANLRGANLRGANLREVNLYAADLSGADLSRAFLGGADLSGAKLGDADLREASLRGANLYGADLKEVDLSGARLGDADLRWSDMRDTLGWTEEQYSAAMSLYGAMMPDGQALGGDEMRNGPTFQDWLKGLKDKEGGDDEERRGLS